MSNILDEMTEASFAEGCLENLDLLITAELKPFASPTNADVIASYIDALQEDETFDVDGDRAGQAVSHTLRFAKRSPDFAHALDRIGSAMAAHAAQVIHAPGAITAATWRAALEANGASLRQAARAIETLGSSGLSLIEGPAAFLETNLEELWL